MPGSAGGKAGREVGRIFIRVVPDLKKFWKDLYEALEEAEKLKVNIKVVPEMDNFRKKVDAETKKMPPAKVPIKPDIKQSDFLKQLAEVKALARAAGVKMNLDFKDPQAKGKLLAEIALLKGIARANNIKLKLRLDRDSLAADLKRMRQKVFHGGRQLLNLVSDDVTLILTAIMAMGAPLVAVIGGIIAGLPALLGAIAAPVTAVLLGLEGIGKAAKRLEGPFNDLKSTMSTVMESAMAPGFTNMLAVLDQLKTSLPDVGRGVGVVFGALTDALSSVRGTGFIDNFLKNTSNLLQQIAPGVQGLTDGLLHLASAGSDSFKNIGDLVNKAGEAFSGFVDRISAKGPDGLSQLDNIFNNLKPVIQEIGDVIGRVFNKSLDFAADKVLMDRFTIFLHDVGGFLVTVLDVSKHIFEFISGAVHGIGFIVDGMSKLKNLGKLNPFSDENSWDDKSIAEKLIGKGGIAISKWIADTSKGFWDSFSSFMTGGQGWGNILSSMWNDLTSSATTAWNSVVGIAQNAWAGLISWFSSVGNFFGDLWQGLSLGAQLEWTAVRAAVSVAWDGIVSAVQTGAAAVVSFCQALPGRIISAIGDLGGVLIAAGKALMDGLFNGIKSGLQKVLDFASSIASKIAAVKGPIPEDRKTLIPNGQALMEGLGTGLESSFQDVLARASAMAAEISQAMSNGANTTGLLGGANRPDLKRMLDEISMTRQALKVQYDSIPKSDTGGRKAIKDQMDALGAQRDQLKLQQQQLGYADKYGTSLDNINNLYGQIGSQMISAMQSVGTGVVKQGMADLGIGGSGVIPVIAEQGVGFLTSMLSKLVSGGLGGGTTIQVNSVDEALSAKQTIQNRQALQYAGR